MTTERIISNSEIQAFKRCRRKWWLGHHRALGPVIEQRTGPLALGDRVHQAMVQLYTDGSWRQLLDQLYDKDVQTEAAMTDPEEHKKLTNDHELAVLMLAGYEQWLEEEGVDADLEILQTECKLEMPLVTPLGQVRVAGKLDQRGIRRSDGARAFRDFKTVAEFTTPAKTVDRDEQMTTYMVLEHALQGVDPDAPRFDAALYTMLRKVKRTAAAKPPFYKQLEVRHGLVELRVVYRRLQEEVNEILRLEQRLNAGEDPVVVAYPSPKSTCSWDCEFFTVCPMFDRNEDPETYIADFFHHVDPYQRYLEERADD